MGTALLALCFCALSLILALFVGISPISNKAKIRFMYVGAALSLIAVPSAAKPTSWLMPVPLSSRLARSVRTLHGSPALYSKLTSHKSSLRGQRDKPNMACKEVRKEFQYGQCLRMQPFSTQPYHTSWNCTVLVCGYERTYHGQKGTQWLKRLWETK